MQEFRSEKKMWMNGWDGRDGRQGDKREEKRRQDSAILSPLLLPFVSFVSQVIPFFNVLFENEHLQHKKWTRTCHA
jgi:hypothetical protein